MTGDFTESDLAHAKALRDIQGRLADAGRYNDLDAAKNIIEEAAKANVRPVDILVGIIAPMLYQIGEDWRAGIVSVADENRFTAFCERVSDLVASKVLAGTGAGATEADQVEILLMNAPGNDHTLGIRILALWLADVGVRAQIVGVPFSLEELVALVTRTQCRLFLLSIALADQCLDVITFAERVAELPELIRPRVVVGGYAVKLGLVPAIPGVTFLTDIGSIPDMLS
jgi:methanogenic corrinoid protein MtbC1